MLKKIPLENTGTFNILPLLIFIREKFWQYFSVSILKFMQIAWFKLIQKCDIKAETCDAAGSRVNINSVQVFL